MHCDDSRLVVYGHHARLAPAHPIVTIMHIHIHGYMDEHVCGQGDQFHAGVLLLVQDVPKQDVCSEASRINTNPMCIISLSGRVCAYFLRNVHNTPFPSQSSSFHARTPMYHEYT